MTTPQIEKPTDRSAAPQRGAGRRDLAVICAVLSFGVFAWMVYGMVDVAEIYGEAFGGGWTVLWLLMAAAGSMLGAGAVVLWNPPGSRGIAWKAGLGVAALLVVVFGAMFFFGPVF